MSETDKDLLRITNQFHNRGSMVYDLRGGGERLTIVMSPRTNERDLDEWRVEARAGRLPDTSVEEWGPTRADALRAVGRAWTDKLSSGLPRFDWEAIARVLLAVRAV